MDLVSSDDCYVCKGHELEPGLSLICHSCWCKASGLEFATVDELLRMYQKMQGLNYFFPTYLLHVVHEYQMLDIESDPLGSFIEVEREV